MSMNDSDDECQILESGLLVQNHKSIKIFFDGFPIEELVELVDTVKKYCGKPSRAADTGCVILSHPKFHTGTKRTRYHVDWLHDTIKFNEIQDLLQYELTGTANPNVNAKIEKEEMVESTSAEFELQGDEPSSTDMNNVSAGVTSSTSEHSFAEAHEESEPQPGPSGTGKPKKRHPYTEEERTDMIQYLVQENAIPKAGSPKIWQKMLDDNFIQNHTAASMASHFSSFLRYRIPDYNKDPNIIEKFQEQENERKRKQRRRH